MSPPQDLCQFLYSQRWFGGKSKTIAKVEVIASLTLLEACDWQIVAVEYEDRTREWYQVPLIQGKEALGNQEFRDQFFQQLCQSIVSKSDQVEIRIENFSRPEPVNHSELLAVEQSNSSIIYGKTAFLKFFRKLEGGVNPELEILSHLTKVNGHVRVPKLFATMQMNFQDQTYALAVLLELVSNQGNAWEVALQSAREGKDFQEPAARLGKRTAELHLAMAAQSEDGNFGITQSTSGDWVRLLTKVRLDTEELFDLLTQKISSLTNESADTARKFLDQKDDHVRNLVRLEQLKPVFPLIRIHGDYHLGQVLVTGNDYMIIDFEGEPARSLTERRMPQSPLIDVAGMLRSFHYAGCVSGDFDWQKRAAASFLQAYLSETQGSKILPDDATTRALLEIFQWQKKLYEIRYELNNRPDWLWIPLK